MTRSKSIVGALVLCALSICAFGAASASAAHLTATKCIEKKSAGAYNNSDCETPKSPGNFETEVISGSTNVEGTSTGAGGVGEVPTLREKVGGLNVTILCSTGHVLEGTVTNDTTNKKITGTIGKVTYTECKAVLESKETRFCVVDGVAGATERTMVTTEALVTETTGVNHQVLVKPKTAPTFAGFTIKQKGTEPSMENECFFVGADVKVEVTGTVEGELNTIKHSHSTFTVANNGKGLTANGGAANYLDTVGGYMEGEPSRTVGAETF